MFGREKVHTGARLSHTSTQQGRGSNLPIYVSDPTCVTHGLWVETKIHARKFDMDLFDDNYDYTDQKICASKFCVHLFLRSVWWCMHVLLWNATLHWAWTFVVSVSQNKCSGVYIYMCVYITSLCFCLTLCRIYTCLKTFKLGLDNIKGCIFRK